METLIERHHQHREHRDYPELSVLIYQVLLPRINPLFLLHQVLLLLLWCLWWWNWCWRSYRSFWCCSMLFLVKVMSGIESVCVKCINCETNNMCLKFIHLPSKSMGKLLCRISHFSSNIRSLLVLVPLLFAGGLSANASTESFTESYVVDKSGNKKHVTWHFDPDDTNSFNRYINSIAWTDGTTRDFISLRNCSLSRRTDLIYVPYGQMICNGDLRESNILGERVCHNVRISYSPQSSPYTLDNPFTGIEQKPARPSKIDITGITNCSNWEKPQISSNIPKKTEINKPNSNLQQDSSDRSNSSIQKSDDPLNFSEYMKYGLFGISFVVVLIVLAKHEQW